MKFSAVALAAALSVAAPGAFATTSFLDLSSGSAGLFSTPPAGGFSDSFIFTIATPATFSGIITSVVNGGQDVDFASITLAGPSGLFSFANVNADPFEIWTLSTPLLSVGSYTLTLLGTNSAAIGTYSGDVALSAAVPEPSSYALMLAGAGVVGFVAMRRRTRA
jgi:hypothetical protein